MESGPRPISAVPESSAEDWTTRLSYLSGMSATDQVASLATEPDFRKFPAILNLDMGVTRTDASPPAGQRDA